MGFTWSRNQPTFDPASVGPAASTAQPDQRTVVGGLLVKLYIYLTENWKQYPQLATAIPALSSAVKGYSAGLPGDPFAGVRAVVDLIKAEKQSEPNLPLP